MHSTPALTPDPGAVVHRVCCKWAHIHTHARAYMHMCITKCTHALCVLQVSGARRLAVWIIGEESIDVAAQTVRPVEGGFLLGSLSAPRTNEAAGGRGGDGGRLGANLGANLGGGAANAPRDADAARVSAVCVVGLAHANGVLAQCAERGLLSASERGGVDAEVARAIRERTAAACLSELGWDEFDRGLDGLS